MLGFGVKSPEIMRCYFAFLAILSVETTRRVVAVVSRGSGYFWSSGFLGGSEDKASACNAEDPDLIPDLGRSPREGKDNPLQYSCLGNPIDRGA